MTLLQHYYHVYMECNVMGPNLLKGHLWDSLDEIEEIYLDTSRRIFTLSLINQIVCIGYYTDL